MVAATAPNEQCHASSFIVAGIARRRPQGGGSHKGYWRNRADSGNRYWPRVMYRSGWWLSDSAMLATLLANSIRSSVHLANLCTRGDRYRAASGGELLVVGNLCSIARTVQAMLPHCTQSFSAHPASPSAGPSYTGAKPPPGVRKFVVWPWYKRAAIHCTLPPYT